MGERGFSLIEVLMVTVLLATLLGIATLQFNAYTTKSSTEQQVRAMYADIMSARSDALLQRRYRTVTVAGPTVFSVYSSSVASGQPLVQKTLKYPVTAYPASSLPVVFDSRGVANVASTPVVFCTNPGANSAAVDSVLVSATMVELGKNSGGTCNSASFAPK